MSQQEKTALLASHRGPNEVTLAGFIHGPCSVPELGWPNLLRCALNMYCSNSFVFGKNCPNFN
jgi:hypothetical protein